MSYAQTSYPNVPLGDGSCGESIATAGCYVTTDAMILTWMGHAIDPPALNAEYLRKGLFQNGCLISSDTLARARPDQVQLGSATEFPGAADLALADTTTDGVYVALRINYPHGLPGDQSHFLPVYSYKAGDPPSTLQVVDSWDGQIKPLSRYGDPATIISAAMRYKALTAAPPAPLPVPFVTPTPPPAPLQPPSPVVPFAGDPKILEGKWAWIFTDVPDWAHLKELGFDGVLIRAFNGESGALANKQLAEWQVRSTAARAAGLKAVPWTYWYGPGEPGYTETDPPAYLARCAKATAELALDAAAWVIDVEAHRLDGLAPALKLLRDESGKAVFIAPPGDPSIFGFEVGWAEVDAVLDGYVPQFYTGAWGSAVTLATAMADFASVKKPLFPAGDEADSTRAAAFVKALQGLGLKGWSYWRYGVGDDATLRAYAVTLPVVPPVVPPTKVAGPYLITATDGTDLTLGVGIPEIDRARALADVYAKAHAGVWVYVKGLDGAIAYVASIAPPDLPPVQPPTPPSGFFAYLQAFFRWLSGGR